MKLINPNKLYSRYANGILELAKKVAGNEITIGNYKAGANGQEIRFTQYTFINKGVLWNIRYSYSDSSPQGEDINQRVNGHIQVTKKEG